MCVAMYCNVGHVLSETQIRTSWQNNPDGAGFAYVDSTGTLQTFRTMKLGAFVNAYRVATERNASRSDFVVHFRLATHGTTDVDNVHPFHMDGQTLVAHNGILPTPTLGDGRSDTATFVQDYLPKLGPTWFDVPEMWELVSEYCVGSKLIILTTNPDAKNGAYIVNESAGHWSDDGGIWFSNGTYCDARPFTLGRYALPYDAWTERPETVSALGRCEMCTESAVVFDRITTTDVCYACGTCQECGGDVDSETYACTCDTRTPGVHAMTNAQWESIPF